MEGRQLTDAELIEQARHGQVASYEELVRRYEELAFRTAYLVCGDADEARDAAQEGFMRAYRSLDRFRPGADPRPWLLRIVGNAARNRRRAAGRRARLVLRSALDGSADGTAPSPEAAVLTNERRGELLAAIHQLGEADRQLITLRWFAELSERELVEVLRVPAGTVKSRLSRAMDRLRATLEGGALDA